MPLVTIDRKASNFGFIHLINNSNDKTYYTEWRNPKIKWMIFYLYQVYKPLYHVLSAVFSHAQRPYLLFQVLVQSSLNINSHFQYVYSLRLFKNSWKKKECVKIHYIETTNNLKSWISKTQIGMNRPWSLEAGAL